MYSILTRILREKEPKMKKKANKKKGPNTQNTSLLNKAMLFFQAGDLRNAVIMYKQVLRKEPENDNAFNLLGVVYSLLGNHGSGISMISRAISINPNNSSYYNNLAKVYRENENLNEAILAYQQALKLDKDNIYAHNGLGSAFDDQSKFHEAITCYKKALEINKDYVESLNNMGITLHKLDAFEDAIKFFERALGLSPDNINSIVNLFKSLRSVCDWHKLDGLVPKLDQITDADLSNGRKTIEDPLINVSRKMDPEQNYKVARSWSCEISKRVSSVSQPFNFSNRTVNKKIIRLGYLSNDFHNHATAHLMRSLFSLHNRNRFEVFLYSYGIDDKSEYRKKLVKDADNFVDIKNYNYAEAAKKIYYDNVDILIDLKGHTKDPRLEICAMRPSPIQVTYLGFPGTSGAGFFDYTIVDRIVVPDDQKPFYTEALVFMPHCYQVNDHTQKISEKIYNRSDFSLPDSSVVFCSFNQMYKIDSVMFDSWMRILQKIPEGVLWLFSCHHVVRRNLKGEAKKRGVGPNRLIFTDKLPKDEHLARLGLADIILDTCICNGHTTDSDALWAGVPVITLQGKHFASRVGSSILNAVGLPELVINNLEEYENLAIDLACSSAKREFIRKKLIKNRLTFPLFDTISFAKNLESAYEKMWSLYCEGKGPEQIEIPDSGNQITNNVNL